jgi:hypothetical protein
MSSAGKKKKHLTRSAERYRKKKEKEHEKKILEKVGYGEYFRNMATSFYSKSGVPREFKISKQDSTAITVPFEVVLNTTAYIMSLSLDWGSYFILYPSAQKMLYESMFMKDQDVGVRNLLKLVVSLNMTSEDANNMFKGIKMMRMLDKNIPDYIDSAATRKIIELGINKSF